MLPGFSPTQESHFVAKLNNLLFVECKVWLFNSEPGDAISLTSMFTFPPTLRSSANAISMMKSWG